MTSYDHLLPFAKTELEQEVIETLIETGSQNAAAEDLGWKRTKVQSHLRRVQARAAKAPAPEPVPVLEGKVHARQFQQPDTDGATARYILTAAQNNTPVHADFLTNLEAYAAHVGARIMVSRFTYNKSAYSNAKSKKPGTAKGSDTESLWYDPAIAPYVCDDPERHGSCRWQLAPDLIWCAEMNILPTAVRPLSGLESYAGPASGIFPHAKIALESVPVIGDRPPKINYTTGAVTQRNYLAKKEGLKGEFHHAYGALIVEVDLVTGDWWARQLNASDDGNFQDLTRIVADGRVSAGVGVLAINWGDVHASEIDPEVRAANWNAGGAIDSLRPTYQFFHDTHSHRARSHHEQKDFAKRYEKHVRAAEHPENELVEAEIDVAAELLALAARDWCMTVVVSSNHDRHGERWLNETWHQDDLPNADFLLEAQLAQVQAIKAGRGDWTFLEWALRRADCPGSVRFLARDDSFLIGPAGHEIECGQHGDEGPDGSRGNTANLSRLAVRINKGHDHKATIRDGVYSAGVCARRLDYAHGPSSWSVSHIVTYGSGKRALLTMRGGRYWL